MNDYDKGVLDTLSWIIHKADGCDDMNQLRMDAVAMVKIKIDEIGNNIDLCVTSKIALILHDQTLFHKSSSEDDALLQR